MAAGGDGKVVDQKFDGSGSMIRGFHAGVFDSSGLTIRTLSLCERKGPRKVLRIRFL